MKYAITLLLIVALLIGSDATAQNHTMFRANYCFEHFEYHKAIPLYIKLAGRREDTSVYTRLGDCYRLLSNTDNTYIDSAGKWYEKAVGNKDYSGDALLYYGQVLMTRGDYKTAKNYLARYKKGHSADRRVSNLIRGCEEAEQANKDGIPVGEAILMKFNTNVSEFAPTFWRLNNRERLVFTADTAADVKKKTDARSGYAYCNIYDTSFQEVAKSKDLDIKYHDGPCSFTGNGDTMYFTRSRYGKRLVGRSSFSNDDHIVLLEMMIAQHYDTATKRFDKIVPFKYNSTEYSIAHPTVSPGGKMLVFASDQPGGSGGMDLYYCKKESNGEWSAPKNIGTQINTEGEELFPHLADDTTLYFSSDGHNGMGGLDIYKTHMNAKGNWSEPKNIGSPINSSYDDISLALFADEKSSYFSSNRPAPGYKGDNIYCYQRQKLCMKVKVVDSMTKEPLKNAVVEMFDSKDNFSKTTANEDATYMQQLHPEMPYKYRLKGSYQGYASKTLELKTFYGNKEVDTISETIELKKTGPCTIRLQLNVFDSVTRMPLAGVNVTFDTSYSHMKYYLDTPLSDNGKLTTNLFLDKNYMMEVRKIEYIPAYVRDISTMNIKCTNDSTIIRNVYLYRKRGMGEKLRQGDELDMGVIPFDYDKYNLNNDAQNRLPGYVQYLLKEHPSMKIKIIGHADNREVTPGYNLKLSKRRAEAVRSYFIAAGIASDRIVAEGVGHKMPKIKCNNCEPPLSPKKIIKPLYKGGRTDCTEADHYVNRNISCVILSL